MPKTTVVKTIELEENEVKEAILAYLKLPHLSFDSVDFTIQDTFDDEGQFELISATVKFEES